MSMRMRWLGTACFEIKLPDKRTLVIDPYVDDSVSAPITSDGFEGCDFLFITHGHYDHILDAGKLSRRFAPKIFCNSTAADSLMAGSYPDSAVIEAAGKVNAHITPLQVLPGKTLQGIEVETAKVALASGCRIVVPQHHDALFEGAADTDLSQLKGIFERNGLQFMELVPG
jgi:L-ascorbate metabolism protein UlaG (beta-lactamase superfamily)